MFISVLLILTSFDIKKCLFQNSLHFMTNLGGSIYIYENQIFFNDISFNIKRLDYCLKMFSNFKISLIVLYIHMWSIKL